MCKRKIILIASLLISFASVAQNLIPNGNFEQYYHCPYNVNDLDSVMYWYNPNVSTPNYFNQCSAGDATVPGNPFGYQQPRSGVAYAGIYQYWSNVTQYREYIESPLDTVLTANECYHFEMYISTGDIAKYTCSNIGVYFSDSLFLAVPIGVLSAFTPQIQNNTANFADTTNWMLVSGDYTAQGGERYLIIGNFLQDHLLNQSVVNPTGYDMSYVYIDDVSLIPCSSVGINEWNNAEHLLIFPNPVNELLNISSEKTIEHYELMDATGKLILSKQVNNSQLNINIETLAKGLYLVKIKTKDAVYTKRIIKD